MKQLRVLSEAAFDDASHPAIEGPVAQLGERLVRNEEASGSIPLRSTIHSVIGYCLCRCIGGGLESCYE